LSISQQFSGRLSGFLHTNHARNVAFTSKNPFYQTTTITFLTAGWFS
jgi:hypothetical protein